MDGFLVINKPLHYTSMDVIRVLRKLTGIRKIGHAGTLDPLATGVLLVCIGKATKKVPELMNTEKEYIAEIDLSATSETDDLEGELTYITIEKEPSVDEIKECLEKFTGVIDQVPPKYSAVKIFGQPAYKRARRGEDVKIEPKKVTIKEVEILSYEWPILKVNVACSKGVYIRSLARDVGSCLHVGGHLHSLVRSRVGDYTLDQAILLTDLQSDPALIATNLHAI